MTTIGFIGLGIMGAPMAGHLVDAGHKVITHTHRTPVSDVLKAKGVEAMGTRPNLTLLAEDLAQRKLADVLKANPAWDTTNAAASSAVATHRSAERCRMPKLSLSTAGQFFERRGLPMTA